MHRFNRWTRSFIIVAAASVALPGCGASEPEDVPGCVTSDECAADQQCSADGVCVPDSIDDPIAGPANLRAALSDSFSIELAWDPAPGEDSAASAEYVVYRAPLGSDGFETLAEGITQAGFEDASSEAAYRRYTYRVTAMLDDVESAPSDPVTSDPFARENELLDATFAIDITDIDVSFDMHVAGGYVDGRAIVQFVMREGQLRPRLHFAMATGDAFPEDQLIAVALDGQALSLTGDLMAIDVDGTDQKLLEIQREITDSEVHVLDFQYRVHVPGINNDDYLYTRVSDLNGASNSRHFPCLNTPGEVARHHLTLRLHGAAPGDYEFFGSGSAQPPGDIGGGVVEWRMDTEVEISSSGVMFGFLPATPAFYTVNREQRVINGIDVDVIAVVDETFPTGPEPIGETFSILSSLLPQLEADLGPLPSDSLTIVVPAEFSMWPGAGPMEFFGGTYTSLSALPHEIFHMYFAHGVVFKTYRDSWLDEAIDVWYTNNVDTAIGDSYTSDLVGYVLPTTNEFDTRAYSDGAQIIQRLAVEAGGRSQMIAFLRSVVDNHKHQPMGTFDFIRLFDDFFGVDLYSEMIRWGYAGERSY